MGSTVHPVPSTASSLPACSNDDDRHAGLDWICRQHEAHQPKHNDNRRQNSATECQQKADIEFSEWLDAVGVSDALLGQPERAVRA